MSSNGDYSYDGGGSRFTIHCDGKNRSIGENRTQTCVRTGATILDLISYRSGLKEKTSHWELSSDAKILTVTGTEFRPDGQVVDQRLVASRVSGSNDFAGRWRDTSYLQQHAEMTLRLDGQALHIRFPNAGQYIDAPVDGTEGALHGPHALEGTTYKARMANKRQIVTEARRNGKTLTQGSFELSDDGRVLTESWWNPGRPTDKGTLVYEKK